MDNPLVVSHLSWLPFSGLRAWAPGHSYSGVQRTHTQETPTLLC